jgi:hypothetical protein
MTRAPVMVKVKKRRTKEGGADVDIVSKLKEAVAEARGQTDDKKIQNLREELKGFYGGER